MVNPKKAVDLGEGVLDYIMRAFHGSPHDFDKFDVRKIGTGEGNQAFGHGLYFAENEGTAKGYRDALSKGDITITDSTGVKTKIPINPYGGEGEVANILRSNDFETAKNIITDPEWIASLPENKQASAKELVDLIGYAKNAEVPNGKMYEVGIKASPDEMLDWDKSLSEQPEMVRSVLESLLDINNPPSSKFGSFLDSIDTSILDSNGIPDYADTIKGSNIYNSIADNPVDASRMLSESGVKGIRYLDAGSRGVGDGTRNMVIFDDSNVDILKKYMHPATLIGSLGAGALATGSDRAMANPIADLRASEAQFGMSPQERAIADLRASESGFVPNSDPQWKPARFEGLANVTGAIRNSNPYKSFTSIGLNPLEGTMDYVDNLAWGQKNSPLDILFAGAELGGLGSMAKGVKAGSGLLNAFGADEKARNAIIEGLLKEYGY